ncbi:unnamed protein product, partial [Pylaiella littoralis]
VAARLSCPALSPPLKAMSSGPVHQSLVPARLTAGVFFVVSMAVCLLRAVGLGVVHPRNLQIGNQGLRARRARACFWDSRSSRSSHSSTSASTSASASRVRASAGSTAVRMTSEVTKTAISRMRVADLRRELVSRGLEEIGTR